MNVAPHTPVLIDQILEVVAPVSGVWLDGTFGAGGYSRALLEAGAEKIIGIDRDPLAHELAALWMETLGEKITLHQACFSEMEEFAAPESLSGIVLDIGVSSMQIDEAARGFSFMQDGPLDMRMSQEGPSAADLLAHLSEEEIADILYNYGEERASRRIARAIVQARSGAPLTRTAELAAICERALPRPKPHDPHPATRSFQALRIAVNGELDELEKALESSLRLLQSGGFLVVVSFHSLEDRIVKRFMQNAAGKSGNANRHAPVAIQAEAPSLEILTRKPRTAREEELADNPRARSAKLRIARKLEVH